MRADFVEAHVHKGNTLLALRRFPEAMESFDHVVALDPQHVNALTGKGQALHELGRFAEAMTCCDRVACDQTGSPFGAGQSWRRIEGFTAGGKGRGPSSIWRSRLIRTPLRPGSIAAKRCWSCGGSMTRWQATTGPCRSTRNSLSPGLPGQHLWLTGKLTDALAACQHALTNEPNSVKGLTQLGQCYMQLGDAGTAISCLDRALAIKPDDNDALSSKIFNRGLQCRW